ncbi:MAG: DUF1491 family protein [Pseudomonadota bacterium]|jgi:hypothetical protein
MKGRLSAAVWVAAYLRRAAGAHKPAVVVRRGDAMAGQVLIRVDRCDGSGVVLAPSMGLDGGRIWLRATGPRPVSWAETQAYLDRQVKHDPDLWVVDIEARDDNPLLEEPIV